MKALAFVGSRIVLRAEGDGFRLPLREEVEDAFGREQLERHRMGVRIRTGGEGSWIVVGFDDGHDVPEGFRLEGLRVAFHGLDEPDFRAAGAARHKVVWQRATRFCSECGAVVTQGDHDEAMRCTGCGKLHFPPISPAVIVLVQRGREALLARSPRFVEGVYSTLAGFVEPGETLEECAHREIFEEVGVTVRDLRYFGSQPHPFPHSLMVGFVADWAGGEIRIDEDEIEDARWFDADDLPTLPHPMSIARALIEDFVRRVSGTEERSEPRRR